jgi:hypothetical protein
MVCGKILNVAESEVSSALMISYDAVDMRHFHYFLS